jgi:hypothetical protein
MALAIAVSTVMVLAASISASFPDRPDIHKEHISNTCIGTHMRTHRSGGLRDIRA